MAVMYWWRGVRGFRGAAREDAIPVPGHVHLQVIEDQRAGKVIDCDPDGTPKSISTLLTLNGMRAAVLREMRPERALILNALMGVGFDARYELEYVLPPAPAEGDDPNATRRSELLDLLGEVAHARAFLKNITSDADALAVTPATGGCEKMRDVIIMKWRIYAYFASPLIRGAFAEIA